MPDFLFELTPRKSQAHWLRRRRRIRRAVAFITLLAACGVALFFAVRGGPSPAGLSSAAAGEQRQSPSAPSVAPSSPSPGGKSPAAASSISAPARVRPVLKGGAGEGRKVAPAGASTRSDGGLRSSPSAPRPIVGPPLPGKPELNIDRAVVEKGALVAPLGTQKAVLTLIPRVQEHVTALLRRHDVPYGAFAAVEPETGRVLALVSHSAREPKEAPFALRAIAPAASIFKLVTAGALLGQSEMEVDKKVCFRGGKRRLYKWNLVDSRRDYRCATLTQAVGWSLNAPIAKMAIRHLKPAGLTLASEALGFNLPIPFDLPLQPSSVKIPTDLVGFGRAAAGFGDVRLSALHAALLAAAIANGGQLLRPYVVDEVRDPNGRTLRKKLPEILGIALSPPVAEAVAQMMLVATTRGTGRRHLGRGRRSFVGGVQVPAKTGSLFTYDPFTDYSWFVGFAPAEKPRIAFAAVVGNTPLWHVRAGYVAVQGLRKFFQAETVRHSAPRARRRRRRRRR